MDEQMTTVEQQSADQQDAFMTGWDDADVTETEQAADQPAEQAEETGEEAEAESPESEGDSTSAEETESTEGKEEPTENGAEAEKPADAQTWTVKHMDEVIQLSAKDITPALLQKGLDYDRVREKYDEAKPIMEMFSTFAQRAGMTVSDYAKFIRAEAKKASGMSEAEAKRTVELEDREAAADAILARQAAESAAAKASDAGIKADLANFAKAFPDIYQQAKADPKAIPQTVWDEVSSGRMTLTAAYSKYAVDAANARAAATKQEAETAVQQAKNNARSTGSMKSAGNDTKSKDPFLEGWGD